MFVHHLKTFNPIDFRVRDRDGRTDGVKRERETTCVVHVWHVSGWVIITEWWLVVFVASRVVVAHVLPSSSSCATSAHSPLSAVGWLGVFWRACCALRVCVSFVRE